MKQLIVKALGTGQKGDPFRVNLPSYIINEVIIGSPIKANISVPNDEVDVDNITGVVTLSKVKIRLKYRGQSWDKVDVTDDVVI